MGRPRTSNTTDEVVVETVDTTEAALTELAVYTHKAISTFVDEKGFSHLVEIPYNPISRIVGEVSIVGEPTDSATVIEMFKISAVTNGLV